MAITAVQAEAGAIYRPTRNGDGSYYVVHPLPVPDLIKRYKAKKNPWAKDMSFLATLVQHPDWPVFYRFMRGTDPMTGTRYEVRSPVSLSPDHRLRKVKSKPGYR